MTEGLDEFAQLILMRNGSLATITSAIVATFDASANGVFILISLIVQT